MRLAIGEKGFHSVQTISSANKMMAGSARPTLITYLGGTNGIPLNYAFIAVAH